MAATIDVNSDDLSRSTDAVSSGYSTVWYIDRRKDAVIIEETVLAGAVKKSSDNLSSGIDAQG